MEFLIAAVIIGGVALAAALLVVTWRIVSAAVDNGIDWLTHTFGNGAPRARWGEVARKGGQ
jgi:hypothetical protein